MDSRDDATEDESSANDAEDDLPTEVPEDSVLYKGEEDGEDDADEQTDDDSSISRRAALGVLGVGVAGGALAFGGVLGGGSGDDADGSDDPDSSTAGTDDEDTGDEDAGNEDDEAAENADPAVSFDNQAFQGNGVNVSATTPGEYSILVTYGDDGDSIVAGTAEATDLQDDAVAVQFEDVGGIPGTHTTHLVEGDAGGYEAGDALTAETLSDVAVADTAFVSGKGDDAETDVAFADQTLGSGGGVSLELTTPDDHFVIVTYESDGQAFVAGADDTSNLDGETRTVDVVDRDGIPGEHTAHLLANADGSQFYVPGDALSAATADVVTASATASVSEPDADPEAAVSFEDQALDDGAVTLTATAPAEHFVLVTYRSGDDRIVAGAEDVSGLDGESITFDLPDDGGVGGSHTAYVVANSDGSKVYAAGDVASQSTIGAAKVASTAIVSEE